MYDAANKADGAFCCCEAKTEAGMSDCNEDIDMVDITKLGEMEGISRIVSFQGTCTIERTGRNVLGAVDVHILKKLQNLTNWKI